MVQYSTKMIFAVLDVSLILGVNIGETDKVFYINNYSYWWYGRKCSNTNNFRALLTSLYVYAHFSKWLYKVIQGHAIQPAAT